MNKHFTRLLLIVILLTACGPAVLPSPPTATATQTIAPSRTPRPTQTSTQSSFSVKPLRTPNNIDGRIVLTAFWAQDKSVIYYALVKEFFDAPLWFEIRINTDGGVGHIQIPSPPTIMYTPNLPVGGVYLDYQGYLSPSARYRFQITRTDNYSLHLLDSLEQSKVKLLETSDMNFRDAYWMPDENKVVFGIGPKYGTFFYLYDIRDRKLTSFEELLGYTDPNIFEWALSPDGKYIVILGENLELFSLDGSFSTTVSGYLSNVRWAGNSQKVYYYFGAQLYNPTNIGYFDMATKTTTDMILLSELEKAGIDIGFFDVSPDGNQLVFWQAGDIWLVSF